MVHQYQDAHAVGTMHAIPMLVHQRTVRKGQTNSHTTTGPLGGVDLGDGGLRSLGPSRAGYLF